MKELLLESINENLNKIIISNSRNKEKVNKVKIRPIMIKEELRYQETAFIGEQVFHKNYDRDEMIGRIMTYMSEDFRQCEIETMNFKATILVSKKGKLTISKKQAAGNGAKADFSHNRTKTYLLEEGIPVPFLIDLGVQTTEGRIIKSKYDKFKQINRFLEFIEDILPTLSKDRKIKIIDFGCGKSYLTFAIYYYMTVLQELDVQIIGLDLKKDVIKHCNELSEKYGYDGIKFYEGDISSFDYIEEIDMVVTLHACDTATDYALAKAVNWKAKVILSVPCCQHEVNKQITSIELMPVLKYGLIKERMSALITDAVRANMLEEQGYEVQILEFIDMEHTPKNILIRAVKRQDGNAGKKDTKVQIMTESLGIETTLQKLLK